jgi:hypothetical protein
MFCQAQVECSFVGKKDVLAMFDLMQPEIAAKRVRKQNTYK